MRPRIPEETVESIDDVLGMTPHPSRSKFVEYAVWSYIEDLQDRRAASGG
jgi:metal-responsive CopG/Arc/MetJ family transcriptional regulator